MRYTQVAFPCPRRPDEGHFQVGDFTYDPVQIPGSISEPEKTRNAFLEIGGEKYFKEGEVAYLDEDQFCYIADRKKDMIISGGVNIYPAEIEEVLLLHHSVLDAAVIGLPDEEWGESIKAVVVLREGEEPNEEEIIAYCGEKLAGYKKPKSVDFVDELPRHPTGKLLKRILREKYAKNTPYQT